MNPPVALHTAARRYCLERGKHWWEQYSEIMRQGQDASQMVITTRPRCWQRTRGPTCWAPSASSLNGSTRQASRNLEETRAFLILAGMAAEDVSRRPPQGEIERRAMDEEREAFCRYVAGLKRSDLDAIAPLPYRRILTAEESASIWSSLGDR